MAKVYEYIDHREKGAVSDEWGLEVRSQAMFDSKVKAIQQVGADALPRLIHGPLPGYPHLWKLKIGGKVRLRPIACKGPEDRENEITILLGATERDWQLPANACKKAEDRRLEVENDLGRRRRYSGE